MPATPLMNPTVKAPFDALQRGDRPAWKSLFTEHAELFDDSSPRSLTEFSDEVVGHERFTRIEQVEDNGCDVFGQFHSDQWGDFRTYFKLHLTQKIRRLDIGQA